MSPSFDHWPRRRHEALATGLASTASGATIDAGGMWMGLKAAEVDVEEV